ncbi:TPA: hypothetical protein N0F65_007428 [Lagenidium giganteum]|uniref:Retrovirus-related Pol polyprotein from transposon TNT 1-94-like beta-barrel domain-containing protein n=1 Tax=Lagenidium giganteum TaxID=4803 RepID=A0AAV2ZHC6_9STRA|nr:TPA: hypothetical protein N0F65_007428 [Lagenidium giganteum]
MHLIGEPITEDRQLIVLLGSLPSDYDMLTTVIENSKDISLVDVKEKLLKAYQKLQSTESKKKGGQHRNGQRKKRTKCNKSRHDANQCWTNNHKEIMFMANNVDGWLLDSGASSHMSPRREDVVTYNAIRPPRNVRIADGASVEAIDVGNIVLQCKNWHKVTVTGVLHLPNLDRRLLSIAKLTEKELGVQFHENKCIVTKGTKQVIEIPKAGNVYKLDIKPDESADCVRVRGERSPQQVGVVACSNGPSQPRPIEVHRICHRWNTSNRQQQTKHMWWMRDGEQDR